jgi:CRP-like cAMP-binding protein
LTAAQVAIDVLSQTDFFTVLTPDQLQAVAAISQLQEHAEDVRIATASCVTPCTVLAIDGDTLNDLMEQDTALGFQLMKQLNLLVTRTLTAFAAG